MNKKEYTLQIKYTTNAGNWLNDKYDNQLLPLSKMKKLVKLYRKANPDKNFRIVKTIFNKTGFDEKIIF